MIKNLYYFFLKYVELIWKYCTSLLMPFLVLKPIPSLLLSKSQA